MFRRLVAAIGLLMTTASNAAIDDGIRAYNNGNYAFARKEFELAAKKGDPAGKHMLASLYYQGHGVGKDLKKAAELFTDAANSGYLPSLANLALMYSLGDGVPKDMNKAIEYGRKAAEAGDTQSQFNLAQAYRKGVGVHRTQARRHIGISGQLRQARSLLRTSTVCSSHKATAFLLIMCRLTPGSTCLLMLEALSQ